ncbi:MAG: hypothetical protein MJZ06_01840 [Bacteroidaceae bacterium]|nr:hypothetical protein [Bacteroidaceae bacterium]
MSRKFVITTDGTLKFGQVSLHRNLLEFGEEDCNGGGLWDFDKNNGAVILFGRSFDFGAPDFSRLNRIEWKGIDGIPHELIYYPFWPDRITAVPIIL